MTTNKYMCECASVQCTIVPMNGRYYSTKFLLRVHAKGGIMSDVTKEKHLRYHREEQAGAYTTEPTIRILDSSK